MLSTRDRVNQTFDGVENAVRAIASDEGRRTLDTITKVHGELIEWRQKVDATTGGDPQRITAFRKDLIAGMLGLLTEISTLTSSLKHQLVVTDTEVTTSASLALVAGQLRNDAGRLSTLHLDGLVIKKPFTPAQLALMNLLDGRIQVLLEQLTSASTAKDSSPRLRAAANAVDAQFIKPFAAVRARVAAHAGDGAYDLEGTEWRRMTGPMLQSIMLIRDAAIDDARQAITEQTTTASFRLWALSGLLAIAVGIIVVIMIVTGRRVTAPLDHLTATIVDFAQGARDFAVPHTDRRDEIGRMAKAIEVLRGNALAADTQAKQAEDERLARDQRRQKTEVITSDFVGSIDGVVAGVTHAAEQLRAETQSLLQTSELSSRQSEVVATASQDASANVQTVAAAAEELSNSIQEISRRVAETAETTDGAVHQAESTNAMVRSLTEAVRKIGDVVTLISDIASQTNLLALNATIEAARAGDAGKGFAVVAGEVKTLANQTAKATEDIQSQVAAIQVETERATTAIGAITATIAAVNQHTIGIAAAVEQQGAATTEIARNVQQAASGTAEVSSSIGKVLEAAHQTGAAATKLATLADSLAGDSTLLDQTVGGFVTQIRAAG
ncbi:methyl-accepting chemotaxis protein [Rhodospirillum rubrum]|uniref:methyl-accepting chemotaxis protein n=1 Tax=Rhodospirillum rubrum TaxID=1085 RepID=UPI001F5B4D8E|nr:HAMP domain-containing methyl-accepting chemotaxis protein [Rhodospirillum rubrum]